MLRADSPCVEAGVRTVYGAGTLLRTYAHGPGTDEPLIWREMAGTPVMRVLHADHQGSVIAVSDASGNAVAVNAYDAWGIPNATNLGRFGYTGQTWIPELQMYHYKARIYSPTLRVSCRPTNRVDRVSLYAYVGNDPVNGRDPTGERCESNDGTTVRTPEDKSFDPANSLRLRAGGTSSR
jgi:RHS repeat-associated protein